MHLTSVSSSYVINISARDFRPWDDNLKALMKLYTASTLLQADKAGIHTVICRTGVIFWTIGRTVASSMYAYISLQ
jgi:hypothetical protein